MKNRKEEAIIVERKPFEEAVSKLLKASLVPLSAVKGKRTRIKTSQSRKVRQR